MEIVRESKLLASLSTEKRILVYLYIKYNDPKNSKEIEQATNTNYRTVKKVRRAIEEGVYRNG